MLILFSSEIQNVNTSHLYTIQYSTENRVLSTNQRYFRNNARKTEIYKNLRQVLKLTEYEAVVNSKNVIDKLEVIFPDIYEKCVSYRYIDQNIYILIFNDRIEKENGRKDKDILWAIETLGGTPSIYEMMKVINKMPLINQTKLISIPECMQKSNILLLALSNSLKNLIFPELKTKLIRDLISEINQIVEKMTEEILSYEDFANYYLNIYDLIFIILNRYKPYAYNDFQTIANKVFVERHKKIKINTIHIPSYGGMDAITNIYTAVRKHLGEVNHHIYKGVLDDDSIDYGYELIHHEVLEILPSPRTPYLPVGIIVATPHVNKTVSHVIDIPDFIQSVETIVESVKLPYVSIIIDHSINTEGDVILRLLYGLQNMIYDGSIIVFLAKSHQKYGSLCTGKIMAGETIILCNKDEKFKNLITDLKNLGEDYSKTDDYQMLCHIMQYNSKTDLLMIDKAIDNAKFIRNYCLIPRDVIDKEMVVRNVPFLMIAYENEDGSKMDYIINDEVYSIFDLFKIYDIKWLDSFGYPITTISKIAKMIRINPGFENKEDLIFKFYAIGKIYGMKTPVTNDVINELINNVENDDLIIKFPMKKHEYMESAILSLKKLISQDAVDIDTN